MITATAALSLIYCLLTFFLAGTIFGILIVLALTASLSMSPFLRFGRTFRDIEWP
jgi:hypothetical protein